MGRRPGPVDRPRRARLREDEAADLPAPQRTPVGVAALAGDDPFVMQARRQGLAVCARGACRTARCPPTTSRTSRPFANPLYAQQANPTRKVYGRPDNPVEPVSARAPRRRVPVRADTARLTEHHTAGGMSRTLPYLSELQPALTVEVSPELARQRGLEHLGWAHVVTSRAAVEARVLVTDRMNPLRVHGRVVHQVWLPYHWGRTAWSPATWSTTSSAWPSTRTSSSRRARRLPATSGPAGGPRARPC